MTDDDPMGRALRTITNIYDALETLDLIDEPVMARNPEQDVLDAIDELVNEQLAGGPVDDYGVNRYPDCNLCPHDWHGIACTHCDCEASTGEVPAEVYPKWMMRRGTPYVDQIESVRYSDGRGGRAYTLDELRAHGGLVEPNGTMIDQAIAMTERYAGEMISGITGIPLIQETFLDVGTWFGTEIPVLPPELQLPLYGTAYDFNIDGEDR